MMIRRAYNTPIGVFSAGVSSVVSLNEQGELVGENLVTPNPVGH